MTKLPTDLEGVDEHILPCSCGDWHYLRFTWEADGDWRSMWIEDVYTHTSFKNRWKMIWDIIRGRTACRGEILLGMAQVKALHEDLTNVITKHQDPSFYKVGGPLG